MKYQVADHDADAARDPEVTGFRFRLWFGERLLRGGEFGRGERVRDGRGYD